MRAPAPRPLLTTRRLGGERAVGGARRANCLRITHYEVTGSAAARQLEKQLKLGFANYVQGPAARVCTAMYRSRGRLVRLRVEGPRRRPRGELLVRRQRVGALQAVRRVRGVLRVRVLAVRRVRRRQRGRVRVQRRRAVHVVPVVPVPHAVQHLPAQRVGRRHPLLLLPPVAEPHSDDLLL